MICFPAKMAPSLQPIPQLLVIFFLSCFWSTGIFLGIVFRLFTSPSALFYSKKRDKEPEVIRDASLGQHKFVKIPTLDGGSINIHYVENGREDKPLMLCLHGFPECWYSWRFQLKEFADKYRVVAIDSRGYGLSDKPEGVAAYAMENLVNDAKEIIVALGYKKCVLVGHDWGGAMTWAIASAYPEMCEKVIVMNCPHPTVFTRTIARSLSQFLASWYMFFFQMPYLPEFMIRSNDYKMIDTAFRGRKMGLKNRENMSKEDVEVFKYYFSMPGRATAGVNYIRANIQYNYRYNVKQTNSDTVARPPAILIWGTADGALTESLAEATKSFVRGKCSETFPSFSIRYVEGASHWVQQDDPQQVNRIMKEFLSAK